MPDLIEDGRVNWLIVAAYLSVAIAVIAFNLMAVDLAVRGHFSRWPIYASVFVLGAQALVCFFAGSDEWTEQWLEGNVVGINSVHARFAMELCATGALDLLLGCIVFLFRRWRWGWWLVIGLQLGTLVLAETEAYVVDPGSPGWPTFSLFALIALFLLLAIQVAQHWLKPRLVAHI